MRAEVGQGEGEAGGGLARGVGGGAHGAGALIALAGVAQLVRWKMRELDRCRDRSCCAPGRRSGPRQSLRDGVRLGVPCVSCCAPLIAILCVAGVMDPIAMLVVGAAITIERLARWPHRTARVIGACAIAYGVASSILTLR